MTNSLSKEVRKEPYLLHLSQHGSMEEGLLCVMEKKMLPFQVKRFYWIHSSLREVQRGHHAHKELEQIFWVWHGTAQVYLQSQSGKTYNFTLSHAENAVFVPKMMWRVITLSPDSVFGAACSHEYDPDDYIHDYEEFMQFYSRKSF